MGRLVDHLAYRFRRYGPDVVIDQRIQNTLDSLQIYSCLNKKKCRFARNDSFKFVYVPWLEQGIGYGFIPTGYDLISTRFGGCYLARFYDYNVRALFGAHIHMGSIPQKNNWNQYVNLNNPTGTLFRPNKFEDEKEYIFRNIFNGKDARDLTEKIQSWGIIDATGKCYSLLMYKNSNEWRITAFGRDIPVDGLLIP